MGPICAIERAPQLDTFASAVLPDPHDNHLLAALPAAEWLRWRPLLEYVELPG